MSEILADRDHVARCRRPPLPRATGCRSRCTEGRRVRTVHARGVCAGEQMRACAQGHAQASRCASAHAPQHARVLHLDVAQDDLDALRLLAVDHGHLQQQSRTTAHDQALARAARARAVTANARVASTNCNKIPHLYIVLFGVCSITQPETRASTIPGSWEEAGEACMAHLGGLGALLAAVLLL